MHVAQFHLAAGVIGAIAMMGSQVGTKWVAEEILLRIPSALGCSTRYRTAYVVITQHITGTDHHNVIT
jgi:hypothetical protein